MICRPPVVEVPSRVLLAASILASMWRCACFGPLCGAVFGSRGRLSSFPAPFPALLGNLFGMSSSSD